MTKAEAIAAANAMKTAAKAAFNVSQSAALTNYDTSYEAYLVALAAANALPDDVTPPEISIITNLTTYEATVVFLDTTATVAAGGVAAVPVNTPFTFAVTPAGRSTATIALNSGTTDFNIYADAGISIGSASVTLLQNAASPYSQNAVARFYGDGAGTVGDLITVAIGTGGSLAQVILEQVTTGGASGGHVGYHAGGGNIADALNAWFATTIYYGGTALAIYDTGSGYVFLDVGGVQPLAVTVSDPANITDLAVYSPGRV